MDNKPDEGSPESGRTPGQRRNGSTVPLLAILAVVILVLYFFGNSSKRAEISYGRFRKELQQDNIAEAKVSGAKLFGKFKKAPAELVKPEAGTDEASRQDFVVVLPPYPLVDHDLDEILRAKLGETTRPASRRTVPDTCWSSICW
jgi:hypothetical protein